MRTVSVIIPTFQRAAELEHAVRSVLAQSHPVHEVLVCDDGSTDNSAERIAAIADERVRWITGPRAGRPAIPRNRGIQQATGEWVAFLDDDDGWLPNKLALQLERCSTENTQACCTNAERMLPNSDHGNPYFEDQRGPFTLEQLLPLNRVICSSVLVRRDVLQKAGGFPEDEGLRALEDYALWLRITAFTAFSYCPETLVRYSDAPANSLRGRQLPIDVQRDAVLSDLHAWSAQGPFTGPQRRAIARYLRGARRGAGRSFTHWLFIR